MINKKSRESIVIGWIKQSQEYSDILHLRDLISEYIAGQALVIMTDEEKELLGVLAYPKDNINVQSALDYKFFKCLEEVTKVKVPYDLCSRWEGPAAEEVYKTSNFKPVSAQYIEIKVPTTGGYPYNFVPMWISSEDRTEQMTDDRMKKFIEDYPSSWEGLLSLLKSYAKSCRNLNSKYDALVKVIMDENNSLIALKNNYIELYNLK